ncbi:MAG: hypothetical protein WBG86_12495 [Polyangiales bacterium]
MTIRSVAAMLLLPGILSACGDEEHAGSAGMGGAPPGTGGASGAGGSADDLFGELPCALVTAERTDQSNTECENGCTAVVGDTGSASDGIQYFVACVADESLENQAAIPDVLVCMTSPVDRVDYDVPTPLEAQAVAQVCWISCFASGPGDPAFAEWLAVDVTRGTGVHIGPDVWESRCAEAWNL